ncbi:SDR family NAD(P)-dependent oxidoreductase [Asticcacaulis sp. 201]|uniref:SDR family NAD(P)-dependent oxidoreductase n=1 Tax=Asticcacaulis sp. 201 TaxID=3028787 RepID=UPI002916727D|nr:SDR family NAD(P)-dependent oxidoreductase [Asticcacaulis sp. 201]MDV6330387.1 SDR family NAD(P)-dependent oxidoreductase [Asticcacaulis sp. 201]
MSANPTMAGKVVLYTGAAGGLGLGTTLRFLERGATVVAVDHDETKIATLSAEADKVGSGRLLVTHSDMSDLSGFRADLRTCLKETGGFDIVINNAAIYPSKPFEEFTVEDHQRVQCVNVDAGIVAVQEALPGMKAKGFGRIINIASITLSGAWPNIYPYVASKGALIGLTHAWAREFGAWGITVNAISPGAFPTDAEAINPDPEGYNRHVLAQQSIKRRGHVGDIANAIAFLAAEDTGFITGQTLNVNGGWVMH